MFSACEYAIAVANILFHFTAVHEFGKASWCLLDCSALDHHPTVCCGKDAGRSLPLNGPTLNNRMVSMTDYDNNDRKKLSWASESTLRSSVSCPPLVVNPRSLHIRELNPALPEPEHFCVVCSKFCSGCACLYSCDSQGVCRSHRLHGTGNHGSLHSAERQITELKYALEIVPFKP